MIRQLLLLALGFGLSTSAFAAVPVVTCEINEFSLKNVTDHKLQEIEGQTLTRALEPLKNQSLSPQGLGANLTYTSKDGLFKVDVQAIKVAEGTRPASARIVRNYLPLWITNLRTGEVVSASGNPNPSLEEMPDNNVTSLNFESSGARFTVFCRLLGEAK